VIIYIKIYGIQRTGTNYSEWLLKNNFSDVDVLKHGCMLGWKHGPPTRFENIDWKYGKNWEYKPFIHHKENQKRVQEYIREANAKRSSIELARKKGRFKYFFCIRSPYTWITSKGPKWCGYEGNLKGAIDHWNKTTREYLDFYNSEEDVSFIAKHADLVNNPSDLLVKISKKFKISFNEPEFINLEKEIGPLTDISKKSFNREKYSNKNFYNNVSESTIIQIRNNIDLDLMKRFCFEIK